MPRPPLPIDERLGAIVASLRATPRLVVKAPPGAGKTTRLPAALLDAGLGGAGEIVVLEPRRIAARLAAERVALERGGRVGGEIGYQVRFERAASRETRLLFVTEGILVRRLQQDPSLPGVAAVVFDEFHERSLHADLALALLREAQDTVRPDLRLVVMSATLDPGPIARYLGNAPVIVSEGRQYPVAIEYLKSPTTREAPDLAEEALRRLLREGLDGSVLVFMPGAAEIRRTIAAIDPLAREHGLDVRPLHGELPPDEQRAAIAASERRRVIVSTNVAEASITVDGVVAVIDSGLARVARYDPWRGLDSLEVERVSRSSAEQRAGRAGRTRPGRCERLYTEAEWRAMPESDDPEALRVDLAEAVLELVAWGVADLAAFEWLTPPQPAAIDRAERLLRDLRAIDDEAAPRRRGLTETGRAMLRYPLPPRLARILVEAARSGVFDDAALLVALAGERDLRLGSRAFASGGGSRGGGGGAEPEGESDLLRLAADFEVARRHRFDAASLERIGLDARVARRVALAALQIRRIGPPRGVEKSGSAAGGHTEGCLRAIAAGYPDRLVKRRAPRSEDGLMVGGTGARLEKGSVVRDAELFVALDARDASDRTGRHVRVRAASAVREEWLREIFPSGAFRTADVAEFDDEKERVVARRVTTFHGLPLESKETGNVDPEAAAERLAAAAVARIERAVDWTRDLEDLVARIESLRRWRPDLAVPDPRADLLPRAIRAAAHGKRSFAELRAAPLAATMAGLLPSDARRHLETLAPARVALPSGKSFRLEYRPGEAPVLAARLQEFIGLERTPAVAGGAVSVVLHLLAPNMRPVQVTSDLASFWKNVYPKVRGELRRRYPKHAWP